jgi:hypothetical protein
LRPRQYDQYCRLNAKFAGIAMELPPMTFRIHIPVMAARVSGSNPYRMGAWRRFPAARLPTVGIAIPAVVSADPDVSAAWPSGTMLSDANRGTKLNYDLRMSGYNHKGSAK